jgi:hypothetical protein
MPPPDNPFRRALEQEGARSNPFRAALAAESGGRRVLQVEQAAPTGGESFKRGIFDRIVDNMLGAANFAITAAGRTASMMPILDADIRLPGIPDELYDRQAGWRPPDITERVVPTRRQVQAGAAAAAETPSLMVSGDPRALDVSGRYRERLAAQERAEARIAEEHPFAYAAGETTGDVATLLTGRAPVSNLVRRAEQRLAGKTADIAFGSAARATAPAATTGIRATIDRSLHSHAAQRLARGAGRAAETGLEAATLELLHGDDPDPLEAAGWAAGGQVFGSAVLAGGEGLLSGGMLKAGGKVAITAGAIGAMWQLLKASTPGGRDRILESIETGFEKVAWSVTLGAVASLLGAPRYRDTKLAEEIPGFVDALAAVPRGISLSLLSRAVEGNPEEQAAVEGALGGLMRDPDYRGKNDAEKAIVDELRRALASGTPSRVAAPF